MSAPSGIPSSAPSGEPRPGPPGGRAPDPGVGDPAWGRHLADPDAFSPAVLAEGVSAVAEWARRWAAAPAAPALAVDGPRWMPAGELDERSRRAAAVLAAAGVRAGDRLVWSAGASPPALVALVGALRLGAVVVPVSPAYTERELRHVATEVRPAAAVVARPEQVRWLGAAAPRARALSPALEPCGGPPWPGAAEPDPVVDAAGPGDPALVVFTSGTTGSPKGAVHTHASLLAGLRALQLAWRWSADDRIVLPLPLFHVHGLCAGLMGAWLAGASAAVQSRFSPDAVLDAVRGEGASLFFGVPTMYRRLLDSGRAAELRALRLCVSGSAPLPAAAWRELAAAGAGAVLERYGMTETLLTVSNPYDGERRPGTVGVPLPGVEGRIGGPDGPPAGPVAGAEGQLFVRGPSVFAGYWERPAATEAAFDEGWFATGDVVSADADGYLSVRGRRADLVISGGFNVYPAEVEDVLLGHPAVAEVAVTGEPSDEWGETVVAWVVAAAPPLDVERLGEWAAGRLAPYKRPRRYRVVEALPRNALGKLQRDRLRGG